MVFVAIKRLSIGDNQAAYGIAKPLVRPDANQLRRWIHPVEYGKRNLRARIEVSAGHIEAAGLAAHEEQPAYGRRNAEADLRNRVNEDDPLARREKPPNREVELAFEHGSARRQIKSLARLADNFVIVDVLGITGHQNHGFDLARLFQRAHDLVVSCIA